MQIVHLAVVDNWFARPVSEKLLMARSNMPVQLWLADKCFFERASGKGAPVQKVQISNQIDIDYFGLNTVSMM